MAKRKNKQRDSEAIMDKAAAAGTENLNVLGDNDEKDPEEVALESLVFGVDTDTFLGNLESSTPGISRDPLTTATSISSEFPDTVSDTDEPVKKKTRQPVWHDEDDDEDYKVKLQNDRRYKQIRKNDERKISADTYRARLRQRFEKVFGDGSWASLDRDKRRSKKDSDSDSGNDDDDEELLRSTGTYLASSRSLTKGIIDIKQLSDLNKARSSKSRIRSVEFHPSAQVALVAGTDQSLNLFQVDGQHNPQIQSIYMERFPILTAHFSRDGKEVVLGSKHKSFSYYDMIAGKIHNVPHIKGLSSRGQQHDRLGYFEMSPDGEMIAFRGRDGMIYLVSAKSKEWIGTLKMNGSCDALTFNRDGSRMFSFGSDGDVYVWDMRSRQCTHKFVDDGCVKGTTIACSHNDQYIATGSGSGVVNVYDYEQCVTLEQPKPLKAVNNLTTPCTQVRFNHNSEILAISSDCVERALKLVHCPSLNVFSNFPDRTDKMRMATCCDFSLNSGYMSVGTHRGRALLYRLKHYTSY